MLERMIFRIRVVFRHGPLSPYQVAVTVKMFRAHTYNVKQRCIVKCLLALDTRHTRMNATIIMTWIGPELTWRASKYKAHKPHFSSPSKRRSLACISGVTLTVKNKENVLAKRKQDTDTYTHKKDSIFRQYVSSAGINQWLTYSSTEDSDTDVSWRDNEAWRDSQLLRWSRSSVRWQVPMWRSLSLCPFRMTFQSMWRQCASLPTVMSSRATPRGPSWCGHPTMTTSSGLTGKPRSPWSLPTK